MIVYTPFKIYKRNIWACSIRKVMRLLRDINRCFNWEERERVREWE